MQSNGENTVPLVERVFKAATWTLLGFGSSQILRLMSNLIMTRLLVPEMFGIMALSQVFLYIVTLISDVGLKANIIRSERGDDPVFVNTAWTIQVVRGVILTASVILIAYAIKVLVNFGFFEAGSAYTTEILPDVIMVMAVTTLIGGLNSTKVVLANRQLILGKLTFLELTSQIVGIMVMIVWAYIDRSIWALAAGAITTSALYMFLSHVSFPGERNKIAWDWKAFWEIFHFGKWLLVSSVITAFYMQGDRLFLGAYETSRVIGIYSIAYFLFFSVLTILSAVINKVYFPVLCEAYRNNKDNLLTYYYKIRTTTDAISMFLAGMIYVSGTAIIEFLYDDRYASAGDMLSTLALGLFFAIPYSTSALMLAIGNSKYEAGLRFIQFLTLVVFMPILYSVIGLNGVLYTLVLVLIVSTLIDVFYRYRKGLIVFLKEIRMFPFVILGYFVGIVLNQLLATLPDF